MTRMYLYKAAKWEVEYFKGDHGMNLAEMWEEMKKGEHKEFWKDTCIDDYKHGRKF